MNKLYYSFFIFTFVLFVITTVSSCEKIDFSKIDTVEKAEECLVRSVYFERNGVEYAFYRSGAVYLYIPQVNISSGEGRWSLSSERRGRILFRDAGAGVIDFEILDGCHLLIDGNRYTSG